MSISLFTFRKFSRPLFVLIGLLSIATGLFIFSPQSGAQSTGTSGRCASGEGSVSNPCVMLHVKLNPNNFERAPTILVEREKPAADDRDNEFFLYSGTNDGSGVANDGKTFSSGDVIWGTDSLQGSFCSNSNNPMDQGYFNITVRGTASGEKKHVNMCANGNPEASGDAFKTESGAWAKVKTITIEVTSPDTPSKKGGIKGSVDLKTDDGKTVKCNSTSKINVTNKKTNKQTDVDVGDGSWSTGLTLDPGTYDVLVRCITGTGGGQRSYDINYKDLEVIAGKYVDVGKTTCSVTSDANKCENANKEDENKKEDDLCPIKAWEFRWAACPIVTALYGTNGKGGVMGMLQDWIVKNLTIDINEIFKGDKYYAAWNSFRIIAVSLIIVAGLIMVVSQAANIEIFDAYTIRKLLPRLLIIAIIISLSWWMLEYIVLFFNNLMIWVGSAIEAPFNDKVEPLSGAAMATQIAAVLVAGTLVNPAMILSYIGTIVLALAVAALALAVRKMIILFIILTAPIFLFFSIFQNTQKIYKMGQTGLISLLAIGIVFTGTLELGHVMAQLTPEEDDPFGILRLGFQVAALLAIPVLLMRLGGAASTLTGLMNDRSKGVFDRLKNGRAEQRAGIVNRMKTGDRWKNSNPIGAALNATTRGAYDARKAGLNPMAMKRRFNAAQDQSLRTSANNILASDEFKAIDQYDNALYLARYGNTNEGIKGLTQKLMRDGMNEQDASAEARRAAGAVEAAGYKVGSKSFRMASAMQLVNTGTGYADIEDMASTLAQAADGNAGSANALAGWANFATKKVGRNDLAPGAGKLAGLVNGEMRGGANRPGANAYLDASYEAMMGVDNSSAIRMKTGGLRQGSEKLAAVVQRSQSIVNDNTGRYSTADKAAAQNMMAHAVAKIDNLKGAAMYGPETNVITVNRATGTPAVNDVKITMEPQTITYDAAQHVTDPATGNIVPNPNYQRPSRAPNPNYNADAHQAYNDLHTSRGGGNMGPDDPMLPPQP